MIIVMVKMDKFLCRWPHYHPHHYHHCHHHLHLHRHHLQVNRRYETSGQAPLHIAASNGSINAIGALVAAGARLEVDVLILIFSAKSFCRPIFLITTNGRSRIVCARLLCITASQLRAALRRPRLL